MKQNTRVLIIGAGPAGLFCADELRKAGITDTMLIDSGKPVSSRICPESAFCECNVCDVLEGEGGAGGFSDGKITLAPLRGTPFERFFPENHDEHLHIIDRAIITFGREGVLYQPTVYPTLAGKGDLLFESYPLRHIGTDGIRLFISRFSKFLREQDISIYHNTEAVQLILDGHRVTGAILRDCESGREWEVKAERVGVGTGLMGALWLEQELRRIGVTLQTGPADIGIRIELPSDYLDPVISEFYDFKIHYAHESGVALRTFCVNGHGYVSNEFHKHLGIRGVNGHSFHDQRSAYSNFAILANVGTRLVADPKQFVRDLAREINRSAQGYPLRQKMGGYLAGGPALVDLEFGDVIPTNPKTRPGRLQDRLPGFLDAAFRLCILELSHILPQILEPDNVVYAPEIKYFGYQVPVDFSTWESTDIQNLYVMGNAAGYTASLVSAASSGIVAGKDMALKSKAG